MAAHYDRLDKILHVVEEEVLEAVSNHEPFNSAHEGFAVLLEEVDELWDEVRKREKSRPEMAREAVQVAAMAIRFLHDICREAV